MARREDKSNLNAALLQFELRFSRDLAFGVVGKSEVAAAGWITKLAA